jgi:SAM-dependent methyltransferase
MVRRYITLENRRILDVGCGIGMYTQAFQQHTSHIFGVEVEADRASAAQGRAAGITQAVGEFLPFADATFDVVFSHEVLEHVADDRRCAQEMIRVTRSGGRIIVFVPNRLYGFETHGIYWRGRYHFGNKPLINWLPNRLRDHFAPHVRAYTTQGLRQLFQPPETSPIKVHTLVHTQIYPGYDNIVARRPALGKLLRFITYALENTSLKTFGLSHFLVLEIARKQQDPSEKLG